ncbi:succinyldiaminopimelate transaminase [Simiduia aestuariiviva]|uniref:N-succinyldiaminopimelate aminotransferase n=1 Tax=Simiduia aestuariiviva TaxID=1510459 RepID=A0A839UIE8_9GAMM|nr:succinyldiaminopimelate transaminase [Simiduia aestuariiviva]MBB3167844.1 N-succinyldiaminopimelate aminotransferase [Simiduia aestuariiviva]
MNPNLNQLQAYPFERLAQLKQGVTPPSSDHIPLSIGEPKHQPPHFVLQALTDNLDRLGNYPATKGIPELRQAIAHWLEHRFALSHVDAERQVLPVNGTREALFAFVQAVVDRSQPALVVSPNPFYQIYEGAAFLAGAGIHFLNCDQQQGYLPDYDAVSADVWQRCQVLFVCSPGNPTGAITPLATFKKLIALADQYDFVIASDECYSELYFDAPPPGLLQACEQLGRTDYRRCVVFHSLSKRSNLPGLRSGFVAGDAAILQPFLLYRTYHGCAMPIPNQLASIAAWRDEQHVVENRRRYRDKFDAVLAELNGCLDVSRPEASFYLWPRVELSDTEFTRELFRAHHVTVLPGTFIARDTPQGNPGAHHVRIALVAERDACVAAARRIRAFVEAGC